MGYLLLGLVMSVHWANPLYALLLIYLSRIIDGFSGGNISTAQAYISDVTTMKNRARGMGVFGAAFGVGFALGPAFAATAGLFSPFLAGIFRVGDELWCNDPNLSRCRKAGCIARPIRPVGFIPAALHRSCTCPA